MSSHEGCRCDADGTHHLTQDRCPWHTQRNRAVKRGAPMNREDLTTRALLGQPLTEGRAEPASYAAARPATLPPLRRGGRPPWQSVARYSGRTKEALRPVDHHSALGFARQGTPWRGGPVAQMSRSTIPNPQGETSLCQCLNQTERWDGHRKTIS